VKAPLYDVALDSAGARRRFSGKPEQVQQDIQTYAALGVSHLIFDFRRPELDQTLDRIDWFAEEVMAGV
jgi:alkanesulfonate monooxygenase SsuD/methylene tetrahydromethanopterin reductase-like flavin-dependent oxidoreductase (luciferase family)